MKTLKKMLIGLIVVLLTMGTAYAVPGGNGKGKGKGKVKTHENRGQANKEARDATRQNEIARDRQQRDLRANRPDSGNRGNGHGEAKERRKELAKVNENAKWWKHPTDERGQGNNGKPKMLDPFGHDKDSNRKELYGNNGRPIREKDGGGEIPPHPGERK